MFISKYIIEFKRRMRNITFKRRDFHENTVFSLINGHSKRQTPLISGQYFFHRPFSGQSLSKKWTLN